MVMRVRDNVLRRYGMASVLQRLRDAAVEQFGDRVCAMAREAAHYGSVAFAGCGLDVCDGRALDAQKPALSTGFWRDHKAYR